MRVRKMPRGLLLAPLIAWFSGCGAVGDVQPPALNIPMTVQDLNAVQQGGKLKLSFTPPLTTTEQMPLEKLGEIELRVGPAGEGAFDLNNWAGTALRIPSTEPQAEADVTAFAGREIFAAVRTAGPKGRWSAWSNVVIISIAPPLEPPAALTAASDGAGVRLKWNYQGHKGVRFRVFRQAEKEEKPRLLEAKAGNPYIDGTAVYGMRYQYQVQAVVDAGNREAESQLSPIVEITPEDEFPPVAPLGLNALGALSSIELSWDRNTEPDFRGYYVYRAVGDGEFQRVGELTEAPAFSDKSVQAGMAYRYAVTAIDQKGNESAKSEAVAISAPR